MVITPGFQPGDDGSIPFTRSSLRSASYCEQSDVCDNYFSTRGRATASRPAYVDQWLPCEGGLLLVPQHKYNDTPWLTSYTYSETKLLCTPAAGQQSKYMDDRGLVINRYLTTYSPSPCPASSPRSVTLQLLFTVSLKVFHAAFRETL